GPRLARAVTVASDELRQVRVTPAGTVVATAETTQALFVVVSVQAELYANCRLFDVFGMTNILPGTFQAAMSVDEDGPLAQIPARRACSYGSPRLVSRPSSIQ